MSDCRPVARFWNRLLGEANGRKIGATPRFPPRSSIQPCALRIAPRPQRHLVRQGHDPLLGCGAAQNGKHNVVGRRWRGSPSAVAPPPSSMWARCAIQKDNAHSLHLAARTVLLPVSRSVIVVANDRLSFVAARNDVVHSAGKLNPQRSRQGSILPVSLARCNTIHYSRSDPICS